MRVTASTTSGSTMSIVLTVASQLFGDDRRGTCVDVSAPRDSEQLARLSSSSSFWGAFMLVRVRQCPSGARIPVARTVHNGGLAAPVARVGQARSLVDLVDGACLREWLSE